MNGLAPTSQQTGVNKLIFPPEFCAEYMRSIYPDLSAMSDGQLFDHYSSCGRKEGRAASPAAFREGFLKILESAESVLEVGPFSSPVMVGPRVRYVDIMSTDEIKVQTRQRGGDVTNVPFIDYPRGLKDVNGRFAAVVSSHNIEHYPDLITHLQMVETVVEEGGVYALIVPDKRFCFDHPFGASNAAEVIEAFVARRETHTLRHILEHHALTDHNDSVAHWRGEHGDVQDPSRVEGLNRAWKRYNDRAPDEYIDVHAWKFTPASFRTLIQILNGLGMTRLWPKRVYDTPKGYLEFCAVLKIKMSR